MCQPRKFQLCFESIHSLLTGVAVQKTVSPQEGKICTSLMKGNHEKLEKGLHDWERLPKKIFFTIDNFLKLT